MKPHRTALCILVMSIAACSHPIDPSPAPNAPVAGGESPPQQEDSVLPPPPSATLRAPADARTEEVEPTTGLPPVQTE